MHIISTQSIIMLIFFGVIGASFIIFEAVRLQKRLRHKEQLFKKAYHCWIEVSTDFIDWRIKPQNKSQNFALKQTLMLNNFLAESQSPDPST